MYHRRSREGFQTAATLMPHVGSYDELCRNCAVCLLLGGSKLEDPTPTSLLVRFGGGINCLSEIHLGNWGDGHR